MSGAFWRDSEAQGETMAHLICASRGPRIGDESPRCKRPMNHPGQHLPNPEDGWGSVSWGDPVSPDLEMRAEYAEARLEPYYLASTLVGALRA